VRRAWPALAALALTGGAEAAVPAGTPLLINLPRRRWPYAVGIAFVVAGSFFGGGAFRWMPTSGVTDIGGTQSNAVSRDGKASWAELDPGRFERRDLAGRPGWRLLGSVRRGPALRPAERRLRGERRRDRRRRPRLGRLQPRARVPLGGGHGDGGPRQPRREAQPRQRVSADGLVVVGWDEARDGFRQGAKWVNGKEELIRALGVVGGRRTPPAVTAP
jgi:hypothetical protein